MKQLCKLRLPQAERLRPAVHNSAYSTEDDQIIQPPAGGNTRPGESLYEVTDGTEFEDHYSVPDDAKPVLGRERWN
nr:hypothetical protein BaRGS_034511 [Batillaria attramentaria]